MGRQIKRNASKDWILHLSSEMLFFCSIDEVEGVRYLLKQLHVVYICIGISSFV